MVMQARNESAETRRDDVAYHETALSLYVARKEKERSDTDVPLTSVSFVWDDRKIAEAESRWATSGFLLGQRIKTKRDDRTDTT